MSIQCEQINYIYGEGLPHETHALSDVSFCIEDGQCVGIIGHTGSGKSTLLQHLNGLLRPQSGHIYIGDVDITEDKANMLAIRKRIGLVFQYPEYQLFEETVEKDVAFGPKNLGLPREEIRRRVEESLRSVGLEDEGIGDKSPFDLSGGQKRRVAIAGVLAMAPEVLILDEPTAGLDPKTREEMLSMVETIHRQTQNITILVSHNMEDMVRLADRLLVMDQGRIIMDGTPKEIFFRGEELASVGLSVPPVTELMERVRKILEPAQSGMETEVILTLDQAERKLVEWMEHGRHD